jgi:hypothetical protein
MSAQGNLSIEFDLLQRFQISFHSMSVVSDIGFKGNKATSPFEGKFDRFASRIAYSIVRGYSFELK